MLTQGLALLASIAVREPLPVPGACTEPAAINAGKPGCFLSTQITIEKPPATLNWHIVPAESEHDSRLRMKGRR